MLTNVKTDKFMFAKGTGKAKFEFGRISIPRIFSSLKITADDKNRLFEKAELCSFIVF